MRRLSAILLCFALFCLITSDVKAQTSFCNQSADFSIIANANTVIVPAMQGVAVQVCEFVVTADTAATTFQFNSDTDAITGAMRLCDECRIPSGDGSGVILETGPSKSLSAASVGGNVTGSVRYGRGGTGSGTVDLSYQATVLSKGPVAYWRFNETTGTVAADYSGNGLNGTYVNAPTLGVSGAIANDAYNAAVTLNGTDEYVTVAANASFDLTDNFTLECWVNPTAIGVQQILIDHGWSVGSYLFFIGDSITDVAGGGGVTGALRLYSSIGAYLARSDTAVTAGAWNHAVVTISGATVQIYLNGVDATVQTAVPAFVASGIDLLIGRRTDNVSHLAGSIDECSMYNSALTAADVLQLYQAGTN